MALDPGYGVGSSLEPLCEKVELFINCGDLIKMDSESKSDPFVILYLKDRRTGLKFKEFGRTKAIEDNHDPEFPEQFVFDYYFEEEQMIRFDVYDEDPKGVATGRLEEHDFIGGCAMRLGEIVHAPSGQLAKKLLKSGVTLKNKSTKRLASLRAKSSHINLGGSRDYSFTFSCAGLPRMDMIGICDPFFEIHRTEPGACETQIVYKSEVILKTIKPKWKEFTLSTQKLCNGDMTRSVVIRVFDWDKRSDPDFIGQTTVTMEALTNGLEFVQLLDPKKKKKKKIKDRGKVSCKARFKPTFLDFMSGGLDLGMVIAIDYTGSNLNPRDPRSLHHLGDPFGSKVSPYQTAIRTFGNIVSVYDSDQKFPTFGFGAKIRGVLSHDFNVSLGAEAELDGILGVEKAYVASIAKVQLYGPTHAAPILEKAIALAKEAHAQTTGGGPMSYLTLLMLTDGMWMDMPKAVDCIVQIANEYLPLSLIIVGVARKARSAAEAAAQDKEWDGMRLLDADDAKLLDSRKRAAVRDVVQFVKMTDYMDSAGGMRFADLSADTLKELPGQFLDYALFHKLKPAPVPKAMDFSAQFEMTEEMMAAAETEAALGAPPSGLGAADAMAPEPPLPVGWEKQFDESGMGFYVNHGTGVVQWMHPEFLLA